MSRCGHVLTWTTGNTEAMQWHLVTLPPLVMIFRSQFVRGKVSKFGTAQDFPKWYWVVSSHFFPGFSRTTGPETSSLVTVPPIWEVIASLILSCLIFNELRNADLYLKPTRGCSTGSWNQLQTCLVQFKKKIALVIVQFLFSLNLFILLIFNSLTQSFFSKPHLTFVCKSQPLLVINKV